MWVVAGNLSRGKRYWLLKRPFEQSVKGRLQPHAFSDCVDRRLEGADLIRVQPTTAAVSEKVLQRTERSSPCPRFGWQASKPLCGIDPDKLGSRVVSDLINLARTAPLESDVGLNRGLAQVNACELLA